MPPSIYADLEIEIQNATGRKFKIQDCKSISGGCINQSEKLIGVDGRIFFCKQNQENFYPFFATEALALKQIGETETIRAPRSITCGKTKNKSYLLMEFIEEGNSSDKGSQEMGRQLAKLHKIKHPYFGWEQDNCIGATPQPNPKNENWVEFYKNQRLIHQFELAAHKGHKFDKVNELLSNLELFFDGYSPFPSLLHGDLWGGNASYDLEGNPFVFDPASYFGDREADIAFTYMFGGFSPSFYKSYEKEFPLNPGFKHRKTLYNLYHELNHFNLFGGGYASAAQSSIHQLISKIP